jgi:hypothetical protein
MVGGSTKILQMILFPYYSLRVVMELLKGFRDVC